MNSNKFNLIFTVHYSAKSITFLDVTISREDDDGLSTCLYQQPTAANSILHTSIFHPKLQDSIPYSQYLRIRRNCFSESTFQVVAAIGY